MSDFVCAHGRVATGGTGRIRELDDGVIRFVRADQPSIAVDTLGDESEAYAIGYVVCGAELECGFLRPRVIKD